MVEQENKKQSKILQSAKARIVVAFVSIVIIVGVIVGVWHHLKEQRDFSGSASVSSAPSIKSIPGAGNPSENYVSAQNVQNAQQAEQARKSATSALPTITRPSFVGSTEDFDQTTTDDDKAATTPNKDCPIKKVVYMYKPNPASCSLDNLQRARTAGVTAEELVCQSCSCSSLRLAGYTAGDLKGIGFTAPQLKQCGFNLRQLKEAGYSAAALKKPALVRNSYMTQVFLRAN